MKLVCAQHVYQLNVLCNGVRGRECAAVIGSALISFTLSGSSPPLYVFVRRLSQRKKEKAKRKREIKDRESKTQTKMAKVALVTGASRGIGAEIALKLAETGKFHRVYQTSRTIEENSEMKQSKSESIIRRRLLDVTDAGSIDACLSFIQQHHQRLDVLGLGWAFSHN